MRFCFGLCEGVASGGLSGCGGVAGWGSWEYRVGGWSEDLVRLMFCGDGISVDGFGRLWAYRMTAGRLFRGRLSDSVVLPGV